MDITCTRLVPADPQTVWTLLTEHMAELSPENTETRWLDEPAVGARLRGRNRISLLVRWTTTATVTAWEPGRRFAFEVAPPSRSRWSYTLEPADGGTLVTESVQRDGEQPLVIRVLQRLAGVRDREAHLRAGMEATLAALAPAADTVTAP